MNRMLVLNIFGPSLLCFPTSCRYSFLNENRIPSSRFAHFLTILKDNSVNTRLSKFVLMTVAKFVSNELKDFFVTCGVFYKLTPPYLPERNGNAKPLN
jgi:hypothetical protein